MKRRKRPQETPARPHGLGNGGWTQDQPGSIARAPAPEVPSRASGSPPLPRPLRFPAEPGWASQPANTWRGLRSPRRLSFVFLLSFVLFLLMKDAFVDILSIIEIQDKYKDFRRQ